MGKTSPETSLIYAHLKTCYTEKKRATYTEMEAIVPGISTIYRHYLYSALRKAAAYHGYLFQNLASVGYAPLFIDVDKLHVSTTKRINKIKSQTKMWKRELDAVDERALTPADYEKYVSSQLKLSAHELIMDNRLEDTYLQSAQKCINTGKIGRVDLGDIDSAVRALMM
jgi:hypothetical protein